MHHKEAVELKRKPEMIPTNFTLKKKKKKILKQIARIRGKSNAMPQKSGLSSIYSKGKTRDGGCSVVHLLAKHPTYHILLLKV